jgi:phosphodiesterase/alkaline phosphatase D-like protein
VKTLRLLCLGAPLLLAIAAGGAQAQSPWNSITLSWTTPGDDSLSGTASQFDLRYSLSPITAANFATATRWLAMPAPLAPGTRQSVIVTGLTPATTYYFAIKTADDVPNWSLISNIVSRATTAAPDSIRPAPVASLAITGVTDSTASLSWTAVGDDSLTGIATSYDIRYSTTPITAANFTSATPVSGVPLPATPGTSQSVVVHNLSREVTYYFAMRVIDDAGNASALSNVPSRATTDTMAPSAVRDLIPG